MFHAPRRPFDIHNMAKPIFDALRGVVYTDDVQIRRAEQLKRPLGGLYRLANAHPDVVRLLAKRTEFVYVEFLALTEQEVMEL